MTVEEYFKKHSSGKADTWAIRNYPALVSEFSEELTQICREHDIHTFDGMDKIVILQNDKWNKLREKLRIHFGRPLLAEDGFLKISIKASPAYAAWVRLTLKKKEVENDERKATLGHEAAIVVIDDFSSNKQSNIKESGE